MEGAEVASSVSGCAVNNGSDATPAGAAISWVIVVNTIIEAKKSISSPTLQATHGLSRYPFTRKGTSYREMVQIKAL
jgi:hypothetical protein